MKDFLLKKMLEVQMKDVPEEQREKVMKVISENPELFQKIALEAQVEMKEGKDQMTAFMEVARRHEEELKKIM